MSTLLESIVYRIGNNKVALWVSNKGTVDVWVDNWSDRSIDFRRPLNIAEAHEAITWAVKQAAKREPTTDELSVLTADIARFFAQAAAAEKYPTKPGGQQ